MDLLTVFAILPNDAGEGTLEVDGVVRQLCRAVEDRVEAALGEELRKKRLVADVALDADEVRHHDESAALRVRLQPISFIPVMPRYFCCAGMRQTVPWRRLDSQTEPDRRACHRRRGLPIAQPRLRPPPKPEPDLPPRTK